MIAWLVEFGLRDGIHYFADADPWCPTRDPNGARKFESREGAEAFLRDMLKISRRVSVGVRGLWLCGEVREHEWPELTCLAGPFRTLCTMCALGRPENCRKR